MYVQNLNYKILQSKNIKIILNNGVPVISRDLKIDIYSWRLTTNRKLHISQVELLPVRRYSIGMA